MPTADLTSEYIRGKHSRLFVSLETLVRLRWIAVFGQALTLLLVTFGLKLNIDVTSALHAVFALALFNFVVTQVMPPRLTGAQAAWHLGYDILQLALLLYLTGGIENPFAIFMMTPVIISAVLFRFRITLCLFALATASLVLLFYFYRPLPWNVHLPELYMVGSIVSLVITTAFISFYVYKVAKEGRKQSYAREQVQEDLQKVKKILSLGALSAAAAHELGTPLTSIGLIANDIKMATEDDPEIGKDVEELIQQVHRCRTILTNLAQDPEAQLLDQGLPQRVGVGLLLDELSSQFASLYPNISYGIVGSDHDSKDQVYRSAELISALKNILHNMFRHADSIVTIKLSSSPTECRIRILDDGPGFSHEVLNQLGRPYLKKANVKTSGMGLGIYIAKTLLDEMGGKVMFSNHKDGGAMADVILEKGPQNKKGKHA